nr:Ig-like domain-containing protein [Pararhodonellum marinum]
MNTVNVSNGIVQVWIDDKLVASSNKVKYRVTGSPSDIRQLLMATFMGGNDPSWAPSRDQSMWMDNVYIWNYSSSYLSKNPSVASGLKLHGASHNLYTPLSDVLQNTDEQYSISTSTNPTEGGSVDLAKNFYKEGEKVSATAKASNGYTFHSWTIEDKEVSRNIVYDFTMPNKNLELNANFEKEIDPGTVKYKEGLVAFYEMDSNEENLLIDSHGENHGMNTEIELLPGFINNGNLYNGSQAVSSVEHKPILALVSEFTLMADIFREGEGQSGTSIIVGKTHENRFNQDYSIGITPQNKIRIRTNLPELREWVSNVTVPKGKWVRVIATYKSGKGYRLYMDNITPESSPVFSGQIVSSKKELTIGSNTNEGDGAAATNRRFEGILDNIGIWNRELSKAEIETLIQEKITYPDFDPDQKSVVLYKVDLQASPTNAGTVNTNPGPTEVEAGKKVKVVAEAKAGYVFEFWEKEGDKVSESLMYEFEMPEKDLTLTAVFRELMGPEILWISPDDGQSYDEGQEVVLKVNLEEGDGKVVMAEFYRGNTKIGQVDAPPYQFVWKDAKAGNHALTAKITDENGLTAQTEVLQVTVIAPEPLAPEISLTSPENGSEYQKGIDLEIKASATDAQGKITQVEFYRGNSILATIKEAPYSYNWKDLPEGEHTISAKATNDQGLSKTSASSTITVVAPVAQAPQVTLTSPENGAEFPKGTDLVLKASAADAQGNITQVEFFRGNTLLATIKEAPYSFNWKNLPEGEHTISAKATNDQGLSKTSASATITVVAPVAQAPQVTLTSPENGAEYPKGTDLELKASATDAQGNITQVEFFRGNTLLATIKEAPYNFNWKNLPEGEHTLSAKATNDQGLSKTSASSIITVVAPIAQAPQVTLTSPENGAEYLKGTDLELKASATDAQGNITQVEFFRGNTLLATIKEAPYNFNWKNLPEGEHALSAKATNDQGLSKTSATATIKIIAPVAQAPQVTLTSPEDGGEYQQGENLTLQANATDPQGTVVQVEFFKGTTRLATIKNAPFVYEWKNLPVGNHALTAKATNDKGLSGTSTKVNIVVMAESQESPNQPPTVKITSPAHLSKFEGVGDIEIQAEAKDEEGEVVKVEFYRGNTLLGTVDKAPFNYLWKQVPQGNHSLTAKAFDEQGLSSTSTVVNISVVSPPPSPEDIEEEENLAPFVKIISPEEGAEFDFGVDIPLEVETHDLDGEVVKVVYFANDQELGLTETVPFGLNWKNVATGKYELKAQAWDDAGTSTFSETVTIIVKEEALLVEEEKTIEIKIGPNPAKEQITVFTEGMPEGQELKIWIISMQGQVELEFDFNSSETELIIPLRGLKNGAYVIRMASQNFNYNSKIIKN